MTVAAAECITPPAMRKDLADSARRRANAMPWQARTLAARGTQPTDGGYLAPDASCREVYRRQHSATALSQRRHPTALVDNFIATGKNRKAHIMGLLLLLVIIFLLFGGGGFYGYRSGYYGGAHYGGGMTLVLVIIVPACSCLFRRRRHTTNTEQAGTTEQAGPRTTDDVVIGRSFAPAPSGRSDGACGRVGGDGSPEHGDSRTPRIADRRSEQCRDSGRVG